MLQDRSRRPRGRPPGRPGAWVTRWAAARTSAAASAGQAARPTAPEHGQVGQVVAHVADLARLRPSSAIRPRNGAAFSAAPWITCAIPSSAARRSTAGARRPERIAARLPAWCQRRNAAAVADVEVLGLDPAVVERDHAVGQDAVDVDDQQLDRPAARGQVGRRSGRHAGHSSKSAGTRPIRSVRSIRPTRRPPRSTTGSSLIFRAFIASTASASVAPTRDLDRVGRHHLADRPVEVGLAALLEEPGQVAVGEDPQRASRRSSSIRTAPERRRGPARRTNTVADRLLGLGPAELPAGPHHVLDPRRACGPGCRPGDTARSPRRVKSRIRLTSSARASPTAISTVVLAEGARPSGHASSIGPSAMHRSAAWPSELRRPLGDRDQARAQPPQGRDQPEDLLGLAALRERDHHVVGPDPAEVAVDRLGRVEREGPRARRGQRRRQLLARPAPPCPSP